MVLRRVAARRRLPVRRVVLRRVAARRRLRGSTSGGATTACRFDEWCSDEWRRDDGCRFDDGCLEGVAAARGSHFESRNLAADRDRARVNRLVDGGPYDWVDVFGLLEGARVNGLLDLSHWHGRHGWRHGGRLHAGHTGACMRGRRHGSRLPAGHTGARMRGWRHGSRLRAGHTGARMHGWRPGGRLRAGSLGAYLDRRHEGVRRHRGPRDWAFVHARCGGVAGLSRARRAGCLEGRHRYGSALHRRSPRRERCRLPRQRRRHARRWPADRVRRRL